MDHKVLKNNILSNNVSPFHQECRLDAETRDTRSKIKEKEKYKESNKSIENKTAIVFVHHQTSRRTELMVASSFNRSSKQRNKIRVDIKTNINSKYTVSAC